MNGLVAALSAGASDYIDAYRIGPVNGAVLDDPVVASVTGKSSPLRNRCSCSRMGTDNSLYFNIRKEGELRCEALLSACNLNLKDLHLPADENELSVHWLLPSSFPDIWTSDYIKPPAAEVFHHRKSFLFGSDK